MKVAKEQFNQMRAQYEAKKQAQEIAEQEM